MNVLSMKDEHKKIVKEIIIPALYGLTYDEAIGALDFCASVLRHNLVIGPESLIQKQPDVKP